MVRLCESAPLFNLPDEQGKRVVLRDWAGYPLLLLFFAQDEVEACQDILRAVQGALPTLQQQQARVLSISLQAPAQRQATVQKLSLTFPLLSDVDEHVSRQYGVCFDRVEGQNKHVSYIRTAFLLDANLRVFRQYRITDIPEFLQQLLADVPLLQTEPPRVITRGHAPVLMIPNVLDKAFCQELIEVWHTQGNEDSGFMRRDGDKTIGVYDYSMKVRRDHFIREENDLKRRLDSKLQRIVFPEVEKTFHFKLTRREDYKVACYTAQDKGGFFRLHRDNTTGGTAHRIFAMSLNLNSEDYEGGYLRFPEYSPHLYKPETGDAIIFSGSIMHEATDVTAGDRFVLLSFFYGDVEAANRLAYEQQYLSGEQYETVNLNG